MVLSSHRLLSRKSDFIITVLINLIQSLLLDSISLSSWYIFSNFTSFEFGFLWAPPTFFNLAGCVFLLPLNGADALLLTLA